MEEASPTSRRLFRLTRADAVTAFVQWGVVNPMMIGEKEGWAGVKLNAALQLSPDCSLLT
jgi:hypothetical protein